MSEPKHNPEYFRDGKKQKVFFNYREDETPGICPTIVRTPEAQAQVEGRAPVCIPGPDGYSDCEVFPYDDNTAGQPLQPMEAQAAFENHFLNGCKMVKKNGQWVPEFDRTDLVPPAQFEDSFIPGISARAALTESHLDLCRSALNLMMRKNQDYACEADLFRNFRYFGPLGVLVRLSDKLSRLRTFEERNEFSVTDESLKDTIQDAINYLVIYYCMKTETQK